MCDTTFIHETETSIEENILNIFGNYRCGSLQQAQIILNLLSDIKGRLAKINMNKLMNLFLSFRKRARVSKLDGDMYDSDMIQYLNFIFTKISYDVLKDWDDNFDEYGNECYISLSKFLAHIIYGYISNKRGTKRDILCNIDEFCDYLQMKLSYEKPVLVENKTDKEKPEILPEGDSGKSVVYSGRGICINNSWNSENRHEVPLITINDVDNPGEFNNPKCIGDNLIEGGGNRPKKSKRKKTKRRRKSKKSRINKRNRFKRR